MKCNLTETEYKKTKHTRSPNVKMPYQAVKMPYQSCKKAKATNGH